MVVRVIFMGKTSLKKRVFFAIVTAAVSSVVSYLVGKALKGKKKKPVKRKVRIKSVRKSKKRKNK